MKNIRTEFIDSALETLSKQLGDAPLNVIEVGCMFKENEGLSTLAIARALAARPGGGRFISIEYDQEHVDASRRIFERREPKLLEWVDFRCGHSLALLGPAVAELGTVHLFSLDGGAHPEVCLQEFEIAVGALDEDGAILVDDLQYLPPTRAYPLPRPLGKGTLVLPMLLIANYLQHRKTYRDANPAPDGPDCSPDAATLRQTLGVAEVFDDPKEFVVAGHKHKMLVYGHERFVRQAEAVEQALQPAGRKLGSMAGRVARKLGLRS